MAVVTITTENFAQEVMSIPTLLVFEQGKLVRQAVGARPKAGVLELLG